MILQKSLYIFLRICLNQHAYRFCSKMLKVGFGFIYFNPDLILPDVYFVYIWLLYCEWSKDKTMKKSAKIVIYLDRDKIISKVMWCLILWFYFNQIKLNFINISIILSFMFSSIQTQMCLYAIMYIFTVNNYNKRQAIFPKLSYLRPC